MATTATPGGSTAASAQVIRTGTGTRFVIYTLLVLFCLYFAGIISAIAVVLAVANLIMDFDFVEQGIRNRLPASESWRAAFGLTITMVWLYTEILRILSYFRSN